MSTRCYKYGKFSRVYWWCGRTINERSIGFRTSNLRVLSPGMVIMHCDRWWSLVIGCTCGKIIYLFICCLSSCVVSTTGPQGQQIRVHAVDCNRLINLFSFVHFSNTYNNFYLWIRKLSDANAHDRSVIRKMNEQGRADERKKDVRVYIASLILFFVYQ